MEGQLVGLMEEAEKAKAQGAEAEAAKAKEKAVLEIHVMRGGFHDVMSKEAEYTFFQGAKGRAALRKALKGLDSINVWAVIKAEKGRIMRIYGPKGGLLEANHFTGFVFEDSKAQGNFIEAMGQFTNCEAALEAAKGNLEKAESALKAAKEKAEKEEARTNLEKAEKEKGEAEKAFKEAEAVFTPLYKIHFRDLGRGMSTLAALEKKAESAKKAQEKGENAAQEGGHTVEAEAESANYWIGLLAEAKAKGLAEIGSLQQTVDISDAFKRAFKILWPSATRGQSSAKAESALEAAKKALEEAKKAQTALESIMAEAEAALEAYDNRQLSEEDYIAKMREISAKRKAAKAEAEKAANDAAKAKEEAEKAKEEAESEGESEEEEEAESEEEEEEEEAE